jgi:DNA-binding response OmpR family regulator
MNETILIVEDDQTLKETLAYNLDKQGYKTETAEDGKRAVDLANQIQPDLVILDIMLPVIDGYEVCRILRKDSNVPIIMLTARDDEIDRVIGLEIGADDYLTKPFSMRELLARVKAQIRRVRFDLEDSIIVDQSPNDIITYENLKIDLSRREVLIEGQPVSLKPKEYDLLLYLARHQGQVLTRDMLLEEVWGWDYSGGSRTVDVHIRWLREKIEPAPSHPTRLVTVRGAGYRFEG